MTSGVLDLSAMMMSSIMSIRLTKGDIYGRNTGSTFGAHGHFRAIVGDFCHVDEFRFGLLDNVGTRVGKTCGSNCLCRIQLCSDKQRV